MLELFLELSAFGTSEEAYSDSLSIEYKPKLLLRKRDESSASSDICESNWSGCSDHAKERGYPPSEILFDILHTVSY